LKTGRADDGVAIKTTTRLPDGNGRWTVTDVTEKLIKNDGTSRTTEERMSRSDLEGRLFQTSRIVEKDRESATGEIRSTVENYSLCAPGFRQPPAFEPANQGYSENKFEGRNNRAADRTA
jgi:hypothetical protein